VALAVCAVVAGAWAQVKKTALQIEGEVRQTGFRYYYGMLFGDVEEYLKVTRMPLYVVRDGAGANRSEKDTRALLSRLAAQIKAKDLPGEERNQIIGRMIATFEEARIEYIGANTATLTFLIRAAAKEGEGDLICSLLLYRKNDRWQVISEVTDSAPVPPGYLVTGPPPIPDRDKPNPPR
jgi:hypothetical protein